MENKNNNKKNREKLIESWAPYNFIPFSTDLEVNDPYDDVKNLPGFDRFCKGNRKSGYITYTIENKTPISIGSETLKGEGKMIRCFRDGRDRYVIPGSSIRGFIRSHAEILSFSNPGNMITYDRVMFRAIANNSSSLRSAYKEKMMSSSGEMVRLAGIKVGYIYKKHDESGQYYEIHPVDNFKSVDKQFLKIHEADLYNLKINGHSFREEGHLMYAEQLRKINIDDETPDQYNEDYLKGETKNKEYKPYRLSYTVRFDIEEGKVTNLGSKTGAEEGILMNSAYLHPKTHHYIVSCKETVGAAPIRISYSESETYTEDLKRNSIQNKKLYPKFYALPEEVGERKLFFYKIENGQLVGFGPTPYFRVMYYHNVNSLVPDMYKRDTVDYVDALFGFINHGQYRSRLSFQNAVLSGEVVPDKAARMLLSPKASAVNIYLNQNGKKTANLNHYDTEGALLKGYKVYLKRGDITEPEETDKVKVLSHFETISANNTFTGKIYYENLNDMELGLVLKSMKFGKTDNRSETYMLGKAKAYGYGKIEIKNIRLFQYDFDKRFAEAGLLNAEKEITDQIDNLKEAFGNSILKDGTDYAKVPTIMAYQNYALNDRYNLSKKQAYMSLEDYSDYAPLISIETVNKSAAVLSKQVAKEEKKKAELAAKQASIDYPKTVVIFKPLDESDKSRLENFVGKEMKIVVNTEGESVIELIKKGYAGIAFDNPKNSDLKAAKSSPLPIRIFVTEKSGGKKKWTEKK